MRSPMLSVIAAATMMLMAVQTGSAQTSGSVGVGGPSVERAGTVGPAQVPALAISVSPPGPAHRLCAGLPQAQCLRRLAERSEAVSRRLREIASSQPKKKLTPAERVQHDRQLLELSGNFSEIARKARGKLAQFERPARSGSQSVPRDVRVDPQNRGAQLAPEAQIRQAFESKGKDLESQDKLGNFEIQGLMSDYNEAETLASSVLKKRDDTASAIIRNIK